MKYAQIYQTVRKLVDLLGDLNERVPTFLVGFCGELLVKSKLRENGIPFIPKGGQAGFDIVLKASRKKS